MTGAGRRLVVWHAVHEARPPRLERGAGARNGGYDLAAGAGRGAGVRGMRERVRRRMFPLIASAGLIVVGMFTTTWGPTLIGRTEWALPYDLWGTLIATTRLAHGNIGGLYAPPTGLISLPGAAVILLPVRGADLGARPVAQPSLARTTCTRRCGWWPGRTRSRCAASPCSPPTRSPSSSACASGSAACSPRPARASSGRSPPAGATRRTRSRSACCCTRSWRRARARLGLAGWLAGAAVCVQPLVLLALPVMLAVLPWRRMVPFLVRAALPVGGAARRGRDRQLA